MLSSVSSIVDAGYGVARPRRRWDITPRQQSAWVAGVVIAVGLTLSAAPPTHADPDALNAAAAAVSGESGDGAIASQFLDWLNLTDDNVTAFLNDFAPEISLIEHIGEGICAALCHDFS